MPKYKNSLKKIGGVPNIPQSIMNSIGNRQADFSTGNTKIDPSKPITACKVDRDQEGNIRYPIIVSPTLRILDLGVIEYQR